MKNFQDFIDNVDEHAMINETMNLFKDPHAPMSEEDKQAFDLSIFLNLLKRYHLWLHSNESD